MSQRRATKTKKQFTKIIIGIILVVSLVDLQLPFILAFIGREEIAETLAVAIVTEVVGVVVTYCCKSFFETREEEKNKMIKEIDKEAQG